MRPKQLHEMEDEFGEDGLMKCFNELRNFLLDEEDDYFSPSEDDEEVDKITKQLEEYAKEHPEPDIGRFN